ncbi:MAG: hypothetical protein ABIQ38_00905 [Ilumatobacteraceae bacterium]
MKRRSFSKKDRPVEAPSIGELANLVVAYAKQETIDPIRGAGRWLAFGMAAVLSLTFGVALLALGTLRLLQFELFANATTWSWVPYFIVMALCLVVAVLAVSRINKDSLHLGGH